MPSSLPAFVLPQHTLLVGERASFVLFEPYGSTPFEPNGSLAFLVDASHVLYIPGTAEDISSLLN